jgi:molybdopterin/thiamine biosynthesis adenylyltransferase
VLLFGETGQRVLRDLHVVVVGAGGGGSLIVQSLAHLGVGRLTAIDYDRVTASNLSRIVGAEPADVDARALKVDVLRRMVGRIDPSINFQAVDGDITYQEDARRVADADFMFLATDTMFARFAFNTIVSQYLVPGIVVGAKIVAGPAGQLELVHVVDRPVIPGEACLACAGAIDPSHLRLEQVSEPERRAQRYAEGPGSEDLVEPSVITLNSIATALATTDFLLLATGLRPTREDLAALSYYPLERALRRRVASRMSGCPYCDSTTPNTRFAAGDLLPLQLRPGRRQPAVPARD